MTRTRAKAAPLRLDERVGYRFSLITKRLNQTLAAVHAKQYGVSVNNWKIMSVIGFFGPLSATELGARTSLDPDKISRAIDSLVRLGYVTRRHSEVDRRKVVLSLSPAGWRVHDRIERVASDIETGFLGVLTPRERKTLHAALTKLEEYSSVYFSRNGARANRREVSASATRPKATPKASGAGRLRRAS